MKVKLRFDKSVQENAAMYFERAKKAKKKLEGLKTAMQTMDKKISFAEKKITQARQAKVERKKERKWFEKFHWFDSSDGFLVLAGRDAKSNESLIKKHFEKGDRFFHADIVGAAHTVVKGNGKVLPESTLSEAAQFAAVFCKAWQEKIGAVDVYSAEFGQVTKQAPSGESIGTGAFMVYGKREWYKKTRLEFAVGIDEKGQIISGPPSSVKKHARFFVEVFPGSDTKTVVAKKIREFLEKKSGYAVSLDELNQALPGGELKAKFLQ